GSVKTTSRISMPRKRKRPNRYAQLTPKTKTTSVAAVATFKVSMRGTSALLTRDVHADRHGLANPNLWRIFWPTSDFTKPRNSRANCGVLLALVMAIGYRTGSGVGTSNATLTLSFTMAASVEYTKPASIS